MKKLFSVFICLALILSFCSFSVMANDDTEVSITENLDFAEFKGNAIRSEDADIKQGLRFRYSVDSCVCADLEDGWAVEEIGVLAIRTSHLEGAALVKDGRYNFNKANVGVIYNATDNINCLAQDNLASVVLINIGYNVKTADFDFSAYAEDYTTRMYVTLKKNDEQKILYDTEDTACVVDVMKAIIDAYEADSANVSEQLTADYESVQALLSSTVTDKNGKTIKQIYEGVYPTQPTLPAKPLAPTLSSKTDTTVTLTLVSGYEYKLGDGEWQASNLFTGLSPETQYNFYQRVAETDSVYASESSDALSVTTDKSTPPPSSEDEGWTGDYIINTKPR